MIEQDFKQYADKLSEFQEDEWETVSYSYSLEGMKDPFTDKWKLTEMMYQKKSKYGMYKSFQLRPFMVKANDDLRQEVLAMQLMKRLK